MFCSFTIASHNYHDMDEYVIVNETLLILLQLNFPDENGSFNCIHVLGKYKSFFYIVTLTQDNL